MKAYWIPVALAAGMALGLFIGRGEPEAPGRLDSRARPVATRNLTAGPEPGSAVAFVPPSESQPARDADPRAIQPAPELPVSISQGVRFRKADAGAAAPDRIEFADPLTEEFQREQRDDSWAYLRESELDSSVIAEIAAGNFHKDRIECRASICLVELSARRAQVKRLKEWYERQNDQRSISLDKPLTLGATTLSSDDSSAQARLIYEDSRRALPQPRD